MTRLRSIGVAVAVTIAAAAAAMTVTDLDLTWAKMSSGGEMYSTGDEFVLGSTIGQHDATAPNALTGGIYTLTGGFWVADTIGSVECIADQNGDGVIDVADIVIVLLHWGACPPPPDECPGDVDGDGVVDLIDIIFLIDDWGCGAPQESVTFDETLDLAGVRSEQWDVFEQVMDDGMSALADDWRCWMTRRLATLDDDLRDLPDCTGEDPLD